MVVRCFLPDRLPWVNVIAKQTGERAILLKLVFWAKFCCPPGSSWTLTRRQKRFNGKDLKLGTGVPGVSVFQVNYVCKLQHHLLWPLLSFLTVK